VARGDFTNLLCRQLHIQIGCGVLEDGSGIGVITEGMPEIQNHSHRWVNILVSQDDALGGLREVGEVGSVVRAGISIWPAARMVGRFKISFERLQRFDQMAGHKILRQALFDTQGPNDGGLLVPFRKLQEEDQDWTAGLQLARLVPAHRALLRSDESRKLDHRLPEPDADTTNCFAKMIHTDQGHDPAFSFLVKIVAELGNTNQIPPRGIPP
jgi:hypothetical protein